MPHEGFDVVLRDAVAGGVTHPKVKLRARVALLSGQAVPDHGFIVILRDTVAGSATPPKVVLRVGVALLSGQAVPDHGFNVILRDAVAGSATPPKVVLRVGVALLSGQAEPGDGFIVILRDTVAGSATHPKVVLRVGVALLSGQASLYAAAIARELSNLLTSYRRIAWTDSFAGFFHRLCWSCGIVKLRPQVAEYADDEPAAQLSRIPIPLRNHQSRHYRFGLSFRDVEDLLAERGITVTYEAIRLWCRTFGLNYARRLRRRRGRQGDTWYLDELFVKIQGQQQYLWRAVDEDGDVLDILVQSRRHRRAATRFFRKLLKRQGREPRRLITDKLRSYSAAHRTVMPSVIHSTQQYENNRAEVSHQSTRQRERQMRRFRSAAHLQRFASVHGVVQNLFRVGRHLLRAAHHRLLRGACAVRCWCCDVKTLRCNRLRPEMAPATCSVA